VELRKPFIFPSGKRFEEESGSGGFWGVIFVCAVIILIVCYRRKIAAFCGFRNLDGNR
jgi:hypothetical protein